MYGFLESSEEGRSYGSFAYAKLIFNSIEFVGIWVSSKPFGSSTTDRVNYTIYSYFIV